MKSTSLLQESPVRWPWASLLGLGLTFATVSAAESNPAAPVGTNAPAAAVTNAAPVADTNAPAAASTNAPAAAAKTEEVAAATTLTPEQWFEGGTNAYNNWLDLGVGGYFISGNHRQFQQQHQMPPNIFGGIEDFHYQGDIKKGTSFAVEGRVMSDNDYRLNLGITREKVGYLKFGFNEYPTFDNGDGGFYPPAGAYYALPGDALELDRGEISFEAGLTLPKAPVVIFKYTRTFREGEKGSTIWGQTHPEFETIARGLAPGFYDIDEHTDIFQLDVTHHIKATDLGLGFRYEMGKLNDALKVVQFPTEPVQNMITDRQVTTFDLFNVHGFSETWIKKNLLLSAGLSYSHLDNDFSGSRIYGTDFDVNYIPNVPNGLGYIDLDGASHLNEYVLDLNLMDNPTPFFSIVPSVRVQKEDYDTSSTGTGTLQDFPGEPFGASSDRGVIDVRERLDLTYKGITNWVFYGRAELAEGDGNLNQLGGLTQINGIGVPPVQEEIDDTRFFQKYSAGVRWYPARRVTFDAGGYYKLNHYGYNNELDSTVNNSLDRYPGYLVVQDFETYDGNFRMTLRPRNNMTLVGRYEYQWSTIHTKPDSLSGLGEVESSTMQSHIIAGDVNWSPWNRLYLQAGVNYVLSDTKTPASEFTQAILNSKNNYWTVNFSSGLALNDKTDLNVSYFYYQADNYNPQVLAPAADGLAAGIPYGAGAQEHGVTAALVRRISKNIRLTLKYGYYAYDDVTFGGNRDYKAHVLYTTLRYRF